jgi:Hemerythrin HHE cation binding domain
MQTAYIFQIAWTEGASAMNPTNLRDDLRREHQRILERAARVDEVAEALAAGETSRRQQLEHEISVLRDELETHLRQEDLALPVLLSDAEAQGGGRPAGLRAAHGELLEVLSYCRGACGQKVHGLLLARRARDFVELLRGEIRSEERLALRPGVSAGCCESTAPKTARASKPSTRVDCYVA